MAFSPPQSPPTAPAHGAGAPDDTALLLAFLRSRDVPCPRCGYNLRDIRTRTCPECGEALCLTIRRRRSPLAVYIALLTPSLFSGVSAALIAGWFTFLWLFHRGALAGFPAPWVEWLPYAVETFGIASAAAGFMLHRHKELFFRRSFAAQLAWAATAWALHCAAFGVVLLRAARII